MMLHGIEIIPKEVRILLEKNSPMNWAYTICVAMYGNGLKRQHIRMLLTLNLMATFSFGVEEVGGMKIKTVVFHDAMRLTTPRKRVDWD